jgi:hypothetical protein
MWAEGEPGMKRWIAGILVVLVLVPIALAPGEAWASGRFRRGHSHVGVWWPGIFLGGLAVGAAISAPYRYPYYPYYYGPDYYYAPAPTVIYRSAPTYVAPAPPRVQREVVYAHGKYVLYGDGVTQPWQWVWVPNAPASPPPPPPAR